MTTTNESLPGTRVLGRHHPASTPSRYPAALAAVSALAGIILASQTASADGGFEDHGGPGSSGPERNRVENIFVIAMENHNFTQPIPTNSPRQILGNPAAPFLNSLITPGNSNATQVSFATAYYNAGGGVHPSEPNYVWAEAGTDFGVHTDADPLPANGNTFYDLSVHLTGQLTAAGVPWNNYQEDIQLSASPTNSASGTNAPVPNPYYGTTQYNYAVKHNPMAFFADSATANVHPLAQLFQDLTNHATGRYNWITPNQYDDAHSALTGGFTYQGVHYTGDQASIAQGDNFLATIIPQIKASDAYKHNGVIIVWWDESEGGDGTNRTIPEIVISPLAKGNAYASTVELSHSSDLKTVEELFGLPSVNNPIPAPETNAFGDGYNYAALVNDLSDLFVDGAIPATPDLKVTRSRIQEDHQNFFQLLEVRNIGRSPVPAPLFVALDNLSTNATLVNPDGVTSVLAPLGSPYVSVPLGDSDSDDALRPGQSRTLILEFLDPTREDINYDTRVLSVTPVP